MEAATRDIEYYDDEELDQYKGRPSDSYNDDEVQHFADVLFSLRPEDARGWARSLSLREINLPTRSRTTSLRSLKDEISQEKGNKTTRKRVY
mgnify:CR=1 FL=1